MGSNPGYLLKSFLLYEERLFQIIVIKIDNKKWAGLQNRLKRESCFQAWLNLGITIYFLKPEKKMSALFTLCYYSDWFTWPKFKRNVRFATSNLTLLILLLLRRQLQTPENWMKSTTCTVNKKRMIKGKIEVIYLYKVFSLYIIRDYCTLKS